MTKPTNRIDVLEGIFPWNLALDVLLPFGAATAERWRTLSEVYSPGVMEALDSLSGRERRVITRHYQDGDTLEQIGKDYGVGRERIRQIESRALRKLRHPARQELFRAVSCVQYRELKHDYWELQGRYKQLRDKLPGDRKIDQPPSVREADETRCPLVEAPGWIPVTEKLPEDGFYLCTIDGELCGESKPFTGMCGIEEGIWDEPDAVFAWMPLPEPYVPNEEEKQ